MHSIQKAAFVLNISKREEVPHFGLDLVSSFCYAFCLLFGGEIVRSIALKVGLAYPVKLSVSFSVFPFGFLCSCSLVARKQRHVLFQSLWLVWPAFCTHADILPSFSLLLSNCTFQSDAQKT